ncbi:MAG: Ig-like domain-containing protein, partial [Magnetococcus sp. YQC-9]
VTLTSGGVTITQQKDVTFTASDGKFANGTNTLTVTTVSGVATATAFTLGNTAGTQTVTVTAQDFPTATFSHTAKAGAAASITVNSGSGQTGTAGTALANPLTVLVKDANNNVVADADVSFSVTGGGGTASLSPATVKTNASGIASTTLTLGQIAGVNTVSATVNGVSLSTPFSATGNAGAVTQLVLSADKTTVSATSATAVNLTGTLKDVFGNIATEDSSTNVTFTLSNANYGSLSQATKPAQSGVATTTLTTAVQTGTTSLTLEVNASTGSIQANAKLPIVLAFNQMTKGNDGQNGTVGTALGNLMSVTLTSGGVTITQQKDVTFTASDGKFANGTNTLTTATAFTLGNTAGTQTVTVTTAQNEFPSVTFNHTAKAGAAASITVNSGSGQTGTAGTALANPLTVLVKDANNNVVADADVSFSVTGGGGTASLSPATVKTNASGIASTTLTLGKTAGTNTVSASIGSVALATPITATGTHGTPTKLIIGLSSTQGGAASQALTLSAVNANTVYVTGTLLDQYDNVATGSTNTVTLSLDATTYGTLTSTLALAPTAGVAGTTLTTLAQDVASTATRTIVVNGTSTGATATTATLTLAPFSVNPSSATLVVGDSKLFSVVGQSTTTPSWANSSTTAGSLSSASGTSSTLTALAATGATPVTLTVSGNVGGTAVNPTASVTIYAPVTTSKSTASALLVNKTDSSLIISGGNGSYTCTSSDTSVATVAAQSTNSSCAITTSNKTGTFTVTVKDTVTTYNGKTSAGADRTENASTTATIEVVDPITASGVTAGKVYLDTVTTGSRNSFKLVPAGGGSNATYTFTSADATKVSVDTAGNLKALAATDGVTVTIKSSKYTEISTDVTVVVKSALSFKDGSSTEIDLSKPQSAISGGTGLRFSVAGGAGTLAVSVTGPGYTSAQTLTATNGVYTFTPPTSGAFAGVYTVSVTDPSSGWTKDMTVNVPYKVTIANAANAPTTSMLSTDFGQSVTVLGGKATDTFKLTVVDPLSLVADSTNKIAGLSENQPTAVGSGAYTLEASATTVDNSYPAKRYLVAASGLTKLTSFKVKAVLKDATATSGESAAAWATAYSDSVSIVPMASYTLTVNDGSTALNGAKVILRDKTTLKTEFNQDWVDQTTGTDGKATFSLPAGGKYTFDVRPATTSYLNNSITLESSQTTGTVSLKSVAKPIQFTGSVQGKTAATLTDLSISILDATGKRAFGTVTTTSPYSYTVMVDVASLSPDRLVIAAKDVITDSSSAKIADLSTAGTVGTFVTSCSSQTTPAPTTLAACHTASGTWVINAPTATELVTPPDDFRQHRDSESDLEHGERRADLHLCGGQCDLHSFE